MSPEITILPTVYEYQNLAWEPCLDWMQSRIQAGAVGGDRDVVDMDWEEDTRLLTVTWDHDLDGPKKAALDALVTNSPDHERVRKSRLLIVSEVIEGCADLGQLARIMAALDAFPTILLLLDNQMFTLALARVQAARDAGKLTDPDQALFVAAIPPAEWT
jgi:hypothetical protein